MLIINQLSTNLYTSNNCRKPCFKAGPDYKALYTEMEKLTQTLNKADSAAGKYRETYLTSICNEIKKAFSKRKRVGLIETLKLLFKEQETVISGNAEIISGLKEGLVTENKILMETVTKQKEIIEQQAKSISEKDGEIAELNGKIAKTTEEKNKMAEELKHKEDILSENKPYIVKDKYLGELRLTVKGAKQYQQLLPELGNAMAKIEQYKLTIDSNKYAIEHYGFCSSRDVELHSQNIQFHKEITAAEGIANAIKAKIQMLKDSGELPD